MYFIDMNLKYYDLFFWEKENCISFERGVVRRKCVGADTRKYSVEYWPPFKLYRQTISNWPTPRPKNRPQHQHVSKPHTNSRITTVPKYYFEFFDNIYNQCLNLLHTIIDALPRIVLRERINIQLFIYTYILTSGFLFC